MVIDGASIYDRCNSGKWYAEFKFLNQVHKFTSVGIHMTKQESYK